MEAHLVTASHRGSINPFPPSDWREFSSSMVMPPSVAMPNFTAAALVANLLFSSVGFVALAYGKKMQAWKTMFIGLLLMAYTYFVSGALLLFGIGAVLTVALFVFRD